MYLCARSDASLRHPCVGIAGDVSLCFDSDLGQQTRKVESFECDIDFGVRCCRNSEVAELAAVTAAAWIARSQRVFMLIKVGAYSEYPLRRAILYTDCEAVVCGACSGRALEFYRWEFGRQHGIPLEVHWLSRGDDWMQAPHHNSRSACDLLLSDGAEVGYLSSREVPIVPLRRLR